MEQTNRKDIMKELEILKKMVSSIHERLDEDDLELAEDVVKEIEESRLKPDEEMISLEDIEKEFNGS